MEYIERHEYARNVSLCDFFQPRHWWMEHIKSDQYSIDVLKCTKLQPAAGYLGHVKRYYHALHLCKRMRRSTTSRATEGPGPQCRTITLDGRMVAPAVRQQGTRLGSQSGPQANAKIANATHRTNPLQRLVNKPVERQQGIPRAIDRGLQE